MPVLSIVPELVKLWKKSALLVSLPELVIVPELSNVAELVMTPKVMVFSIVPVLVLVNMASLEKF